MPVAIPEITTTPFAGRNCFHVVVAATADAGRRGWTITETS
jgi:hypothetical protein